MNETKYLSSISTDGTGIIDYGVMGGSSEFLTPNQETVDSLKKSDSGIDVVRFDTVSEFMTDLLSD